MILVTIHIKITMNATLLHASPTIIGHFFEIQGDTLVIFADPGLDTDDVLAFLTLASSSHLKLVFVCCGANPITKAQYLKGLVNTLPGDHLNIIVAAGTDCNVVEKSQYHEHNDLSFTLASVDEIVMDWEWLISEILIQANPKEVSFLGIGPMTDLCKALFANETAKLAINTIVLMCDIATQDGKLVEDWFIPMFGIANNGTFDSKATAALYAKMFMENYYHQTIVVSKHAAAAAKVGFDFYRRLLSATDNHPGAQILFSKQQAGLKYLFYRASADPNTKEGKEVRGSLVNEQDKHWFNITFCNSELPDEILNDPDSDPIGYLIERGLEGKIRFQLYDAIAAIVLLLSLYDEKAYSRIFKPILVQNTLQVIGFDANTSGVNEPECLVELIASRSIRSMTPSKTA
ncbi:MAG: hypothetical protein ACRCXZ_07870 [Patescibacteria group bacterium]